MRLPSLSIMKNEEIEELDTTSNLDTNVDQQNRNVKQDGQVLSFTPQQGHIFGGQSIFLSFIKLEAPLADELFYYVIFKGSSLRHITSAKILNPYTLQAVIPDHDQAELVSLSICQIGSTINNCGEDSVENTISSSKILVTETFTFTSDSSQFFAQQLITNSLDVSGLKHLETVYASLLNVSVADRRELDAKLAASFRNISRTTPLLLSDDVRTRDDDNGWNLLHFCAKHSLCQLAEYLLTKKGAKHALVSVDDHGCTPVDIASQSDHKKLVEILSRVPCEEESHVISTSDVIKRPSVKRHKLGTTTITNSIGEGSDDLDKDLMLLKEVNGLAADSHGAPQVNGNHPRRSSSDEGSPLSDSLKKLQEINDEIRRLRSLSYKDSIEQYEKEMNGEVDANDLLPDETKADEDDEDFLDIGLNEANNNIVEKQPTLNDIVIPPVAEDLPENNILDDDVTHLQTSAAAATTTTDDIRVVEQTKIINLEARDTIDTDTAILDNGVSLIKIEEHAPLQVLEIVPSVEEITPQVTEIIIEGEVIDEDVTDPPVHNDTDDDIDDNCLIPGDLNFKLESVTEETEEELKADGSGRSPVMRRQKHDGLVSVTQTQSLTELPPHPPKRVGILKRQGCKKDRPLSDSFENLKMVEKQGIVDLFQGTTNQNSLSNSETNPHLVRGYSLDALMTQHEEGIHSEPSATSQNSLSGPHDSQESLTSDCDSPKCRSRSGSEKMSSRASSHSLNDALISRCSSMSSQEELNRSSSTGKKIGGSSLFRVFSVKKAKSLSALETTEAVINEDDRRKTIIGDVDLISDQSRHPSSKESDDLVTQQDVYGDILVRCISYDSDVKKSQSTVSMDTVGKDGEKEQESSLHRRMSTSALLRSYQRRFTNSDEDTDEGTSTDIAEKQERKSTGDEKARRRFGILRKTKDKDKKSVKEKEKNYRDRKDSEGKTKKKPPVPESKGSFLSSKRGSSFRQNLSKGPDLKVSEKPMLRGLVSSSSGNNNVNKSRSSDRKSPMTGRKFSNINSGNGALDNYDGEYPNLMHSKNLSSSRTSIDSLGFTLDADDTDYSPYNNSLDEPEYDSDLDAQDVPETWSELVDKKVQRKMHAKDIKRQDVIYELIQTEAQYVRTLYIMKKIYSMTMVNLNFDEQTINTIFPELNELIDLNGGFLKDMKKRQETSSNNCIENIGDILHEFFGGEKGGRLKLAYGNFCSKHLEAVAKHKELLKLDKKFAACMKKCLLNERSRRLSIPECITYVTIRMTKYPLLIEAIIKATKEAKPDYEYLKSSLHLVKECLKAVDDAVDENEQRKELENLKKNLDKKNVVEIKIGQTKNTYRANKLFHKRSKLVCDKKTVLRGKNKPHETRMVVLAEKIIFFQDNGGKLQLLQVDSKAPVLPLKNLMVREVATDNKALFLVSTSKDAAQIYEIVCDSYKDKKEFMTKLRRYIKNCPDEEEAITDNEEEAKREEEERMAKLKELIEQLQNADDTVSRAFAEKNRLVGEMRGIIETMDDGGPEKSSSCCELKPSEVVSARETLEACINEVNILSSSVSSPQQADAPLSFPTSVPASPANSANSFAVNKRSETYSSSDLRKPSFSSNNINRTVSMKPNLGKPSAISETDSGPTKRRQSQLLSVLGRTKTMGSTEDLTSISSSSTSISTISSAMSQMQLFQNLRDHLTSLVDVTNKQDVEIAKMRFELQEARSDIGKLRTEKKELEEKVSVQQKEFDRNIRNEQEKYNKLTREFKRTTDKMNRQYEDKKAHYNQLLEALNAERSGRKNSEDAVYL